jgi:hypothetical protein
MTLANTTSKIRLFINGKDYSNFLIEGSTSDDSAYSTNIITTKGSIVLGGDTTILDYNKTLFPLGSRVNVYATLDNGKAAKLPRGQLYVLNSSIDINSRQTTLEVGCSLAYLVSRESSYVPEIRTLITSFVSSEIKKSFIIDDYNLSTLQTLLEINGRVIFQDSWGHIQTVNQFGDDGLGSNLSKAKLTSFDEETAIAIDSIGGAIEDLPSAVIATTDVEVPSSSTDNNEESPNPPPFITSQAIRTISVPDAEKAPTFFKVENDLTSGEATTEAVAGCGTIETPVASAPSTFAYTAKGSCTTGSREVKEQVTQGRYVSYEGPGNQVEWEYDFEYCSAATYANGLISGVVNLYSNSANTEVEKANALLSKANQAYTLRDDYASRPSTPQSAAAIQYHGCAADQYYNAAVDILKGAEKLAKEATNFADSRTGDYGYSRMQQTYYFYGDSSQQLIQKVQFNYIHAAASVAAERAVNKMGVAYRASAFTDKMRYQIANELDFSPFRSLNKSFEQTIQGDTLVGSHDDTKYKNPLTFFNLVLASRTVTGYSYGTVYNAETEVFTDFEEPSNNYKRINYSSSGSSSAIEPDRIEYQRDGDGCLYSNDSSSETESKEITSTVRVSITNKVNASTVPVAWLGTPGRAPKEVQLPLSFAPIRTKICNGVKFVPDASAKLSIYGKILAKYASNLAKKITADNFGYRITEKGTRAEIFEYYPFYPISLNLASLGKKYKLRAASSNWVFDSDNVLCSFDCFNVGGIETTSTAQAAGGNYLAFLKGAVTTGLTNSYFNLPQTAASIKITSLPSTGTINLNGTPVSVGTTITSTQINAGNVVFVPSTSNTVSIEVGFQAFSLSGRQITSTDGIYPPVQVDLATYLFADAGDFTNNTTNGGFDSDAGNFDAGTRPGGPFSLNAGDFDTGAAVVVGEPGAPAGASTGNNTVNPEIDSGISVVDVNDALISSDTLPTPVGDLSPNFEIIIDFRLTPSAYFRLATAVLPLLGWNYYYIAAPLGTAIDMGTVADANNYTMNFGTILIPNEPVLASSVV